MKHANPVILACIEEMLHEQVERVMTIPEEHKAVVELLSKRLVDRKSLTGEEVRQAIEEMRRPAPVARAEAEIDEMADLSGCTEAGQCASDW